MTFEEAKKILKKEGYDVEKVGRPSSPSIVFTAYESPEICEAMQVVCSAGYGISMVSSRFDDRKARLSLELAENSAPMPGPGEEQPKEGNPALKEAASRFNDALLDEQAKKIKSLVKDITHMDNVIYKKNLEIDKQNQEITRLLSLVEKKEGYNLKQIKCLGKEIARLNKIIHEKKKVCCELVAENTDLKERLTDKDAVLSDVAEELRLSKIREKNLTEVSQKYMKENEELKKKLADKVVEKIDVQAFKNAESALAWKDRVIYYKDMAIAYNEKEIADLGKELKATKKELKEKTKLFEMIRNASKEYCDYGVAANEFIKELASLYVLANNTGIINDEMLERCKNYQTYGFPANCNRETKKEINDIARGKTKVVGADIAEEGGDHSAIIAQCCKNIAISKEEAKIIERCTKNGTELHYSEKDGFTYTNMFGDEMPIICLRGLCQVFTDEEIKNMKK